ncbi:MAG: hypothetical protein RL728_938 [Bacteroidota bacterium]|jgi:hypothetical protein
MDTYIISYIWSKNNIVATSLSEIFKVYNYGQIVLEIPQNHLVFNTDLIILNSYYTISNNIQIK